MDLFPCFHFPRYELWERSFSPHDSKWSDIYNHRTNPSFLSLDFARASEVFWGEERQKLIIALIAPDILGLRWKHIIRGETEWYAMCSQVYKFKNFITISFCFTDLHNVYSQKFIPTSKELLEKLQISSLAWTTEPYQKSSEKRYVTRSTT
jgi:hypothetical protein